MCLIGTLLRWTIYALGKRFKDKMNYMVVGLFIFEQLAITLTTVLLKNQSSSEYVVHFENLIVRHATFYQLFLSPSVSYLLIYTLVLFLNVSLLTLSHYEADDELANKSLRQTIALGLCCAALYWILQKRELKNFFKQQNA